MLALKTTLSDHGISQAALAKAIRLSPATIAQIINHNHWPKKPDPKQVKGLITEALADQNITVDAAMFKPVAAVDATAPKLNEDTLDMLLRKQTLSPAARRHFNLFRNPFDNEITEAEDVYASPTIRFVREYMHTTANLGGFVAIVGESGAGKSTLRKDLEDRIARESASIILIQPYVLGMEDNDKKGKTLKSASIADAIINTVAPNATPKASMEAKSRQLHKILKDSHTSGMKHCLIIEEAHALSTPTLKHLKRFFELEIGFKKLISIILIGQTELKTKLSDRSPEVREVVQRCELIELPPLDTHLDDYLRFKFQRVGAELQNIFEKDAADAIRARLIFTKPSKTNRETISMMYPLMINNLVVGAMNQAAELGFTKVSGDLIREA
jgi:type II secretory pathway predicted ATPase ExeA